MNVEVDREAKAYLCWLIRLPILLDIPVEIHKEGWCCWINGEKLTPDHSEKVRRKVAADKLRAFPAKRG